MDPQTDVRVIQQHGTLQVLAQRAEILFRDGSSVGLHPVAVEGLTMMFLRALHHEGLRWHVVDLRHVGGAEIETDLLRLLPSDSHGVVLFTLRGIYEGARAFAAAVVAHTQSSWRHLDEAAP